MVQTEKNPKNKINRRNSLKKVWKIIFFFKNLLVTVTAKNEDESVDIFSLEFAISLARFVKARKNYLHIKPCMLNYIHMRHYELQLSEAKNRFHVIIRKRRRIFSNGPLHSAN